jgi:hypothetical protein
MTIYTKTVTLAAGATAEVFTELGVSPMRGEVLFQLEVSSGYVLWCQLSDAAGANLGPFVPASTAMSIGGAEVVESRVRTDKDAVYFTNTGAVTASVLVAFFPRA